MTHVCLLSVDRVFSSWIPLNVLLMSESSNSYGSTCSRSGRYGVVHRGTSVLIRCKAHTAKFPFRTTAATAASTCCNTLRVFWRTLWCTLTSLYSYNDGFLGSRCGGNETKSEIWSSTFTDFRTWMVTDKAALLFSASHSCSHYKSLLILSDGHFSVN